MERSRELLLIVDEGDNKPLPLTAVKLLLPGWQLRFHRPPGPLRLLYGNDDIGKPRYDVAVLAPSVMTGTARDVVAEPERAPEPPAPIVSPRAFWVGLGCRRGAAARAAGPAYFFRDCAATFATWSMTRSRLPLQIFSICASV